VLGSEQKHLRDAGAGQTRVEQCARIIHRKPSIRFDNQLFALAMKLPRIRLSGFRVPEFKTPALAATQLLRLRWPPAASEVRGCCDGDNGGVQKLSSNQTG
jgi:hypothetical protein